MWLASTCRKYLELSRVEKVRGEGRVRAPCLKIIAVFVRSPPAVFLCTLVSTHCVLVHPLGLSARIRCALPTRDVYSSLSASLRHRERAARRRDCRELSRDTWRDRAGGVQVMCGRRRGGGLAGGRAGGRARSQDRLVEIHARSAFAEGRDSIGISRGRLCHGGAAM